VQLSVYWFKTSVSWCVFWLLHLVRNIGSVTCKIPQCRCRSLLTYVTVASHNNGHITLHSFLSALFNRLKPNDPYRGRTTPLTSKRCILYIYSTNIGTEYFKHGVYSPFFFSSKCSLFHNSNLFGSCIIHILYTGCAKIKNYSGAKRLTMQFPDMWCQ